MRWICCEGMCVGNNFSFKNSKNWYEDKILINKIIKIFKNLLFLTFLAAIIPVADAITIIAIAINIVAIAIEVIAIAIEVIATVFEVVAGAFSSVAG